MMYVYAWKLINNNWRNGRRSQTSIRFWSISQMKKWSNSHWLISEMHEWSNSHYVYIRFWSYSQNVEVVKFPLMHFRHWSFSQMCEWSNSHSCIGFGHIPRSWSGQIPTGAIPALVIFPDVRVVKFPLLYYRFWSYSQKFKWSNSHLCIF